MLQGLAKHDAKGENRYFFFRLDDLEMGIKIIAVREIISLPLLPPRPGWPKLMVGTIERQNQVIPVLDLRYKLLTNNFTPGDSTDKIVVINMEGVKPRSMIGLVVDTIVGTESIAAQQITTQQIMLPPSVRQAVGRSDNLIQGVLRNGSHSRVLLAVDQLLRLDELREFGGPEPSTETTG